MEFSQQEQEYMRRALDLAWKGRFSTSPNPRVGCVLVKGKQIIGEGFHLRAGTPHAEIHALNQAGDDAKGATAYVTLEPCSHYGRTAPCADALLTAGIARVVVAMKDPNPLVAGSGLARLEQAGVQVKSGLFEVEARELNRGFLSRIERRHPFVKMKIATSLDSKIALFNGKSQWITGEEARADVQILRAESCAILTGVGTILADNPKLNVRDFPVLRQPIRIIVDTNLSIPQYSHVLNDGGETWIFTKNQKFLKNYPKHIRIIQIDDDQKIDLKQVLKILAENGIGELMVEAGATLNTALLQMDCVDEMVLYQSPKILGEGRDMFNLPAQSMALLNQPYWYTQSVKILGDDIKWVLRKK